MYCTGDFSFLLVNWKDLTLEERRTVSVIFQDLEKYFGMARRKERRIYWYHVAKIVKVNHQKGCLGTYWQKKSPVIVKQFFRLSAQSYVCRRNSCKDAFLFYEFCWWSSSTLILITLGLGWWLERWQGQRRGRGWWWWFIILVSFWFMNSTNR